MNFNNLNINEKLVPANYLKLAQDTQRSNDAIVKELLDKRKLPENGLPDELIESVVRQIAQLDSNNFAHKAGLGEREARIACKLVGRRHYNFAHGIGRSGDLLEPQPKAAGSTILSNLTNRLLLDLIHEVGVRSCRSCFLVPMATGMTLTLCLLTLRKLKPNAKYVIWSRIDQKSCFKCITTAGLTPVILNQQLDIKEKCLTTDIAGFERKIIELGADNIVCLFSTTSCFAPRTCDDIQQLARLASSYDLSHLVNNAYGLQSTFLTHQLEQAHRVGRVDLFVQSTDKNLMVPVGGAIVAGFDENIVRSVAKTYAGRASSSQTLDVFMTLLSLGKTGYHNLVKERKENFKYLRSELEKFAQEFNEIVFETKGNQISLALTLQSFQNDSRNASLTRIGSMLYSRCVSGVRVVPIGDNKQIDGHHFSNWGSHHPDSKIPYLTVAASIGITANEIDVFFRKLNDCWKHIITK